MNTAMTGGVRGRARSAGRRAWWSALAAADRAVERMAVLRERAGLTGTGALVLWTSLAAWVAGRVVGGTPLYVVAYGCGLLVVLGRTLGTRRPSLVAERTGLYARVMEGDRLDVTVDVEAARPVGSLLVEDGVDPRLRGPVRFPLQGLGRGGRVSHSYRLEPRRRGAYTVGPLSAVSADPMGFTKRTQRLADAVEILVHPRVTPIPERLLSRRFDDPPVRPPVTKPWPTGLEFHGMRDYVPGDDLRRVVWRATARAGRLVVREAEQGTSDRVTIVLDTRRSAHSVPLGGVSESFEAAVRVAASIGVRHLLDGYQVSTYVGGGPLTRPLRGTLGRLDLLDALARVDADDRPVAPTLARLVVDPHRDGDVVAVVPELDGDVAAQLRLLVQRGTSVLVVALQFDDHGADFADRAAALGCRIVKVGPDDDLALALASEVGAGMGR